MNNTFCDLTGRVAVVLGGTSGLGRAIAIGLAQAGADVVASGRRAEQQEEICGEITRLGRKTLKATVDVCDRASIDRLRDATLEQFGHIDILVNAFGRTARTPTVKMDEKEWTAIMDVNLTGILRACQSFHGALKGSGRGRVINIASLTSYLAFHEVAAYG